MFKSPLRTLALLGILCAVSLTQIRAAADGSFSPIKLRAYGTVSAKQKLFPGDPKSSLLTIQCESEPKARLVLAKYLSDLGLLPGVTTIQIQTARGAVTARQVEAQGVVAAARSGTRVFVLTAADGPALKSLIESTFPTDAKIDATDPEITVPMYVDRWDKHGFRFYYGPFIHPGYEINQPIDFYDSSQDFTFAKQAGDVGLVVWNTPQGDGIMDLNSREWIYDAAKRAGLPLGINDGIEGDDHAMMNHYPQGMVPNAASYLGGWYGALNLGITVAWSDTKVQDAALGEIQNLIRDLDSRYDNIINWLEPHEEMCHGDCDVIDDHGPSANASFHAYLKSKYGTPAAVARRWSQPGAFKTWSDVPFPEVATFLGWNAGAFDLTGTWKINYDAPYGADSAATTLDDSKWPPMQAPGHAVAQMNPRRPAVFRRHFTLDPAWRKAHPRVWLYLWDLNDTRRRDVLVFMNGKPIEDPLHGPVESHFCAVEVTSALTDGSNVLTLCLPQAIITYRCYLSGDAPHVYPDLGPQMNAEWADFSDWTAWSRGMAVRRGAQMIRQVDPDRPITLMSPDVYLSPIKAVAEDYGGIVHDTGGMAGSWGDGEPVMLQSAGLPTDCEPGSGAVDLNDFKRFMGRWSTEGTQGVDYFQHMGDIEWKPAVKDYFLKTLKLWHLIGKYHLPHAEVAILNSDRNLRLTGFPWNRFDSTAIIFNQRTWWPLINWLLPDFPRAGVVEDDFARGNVDQFRVVVDGNTTIMDPETVNQIEKWVRRGGTFVTYQQTGRHTSAQLDAWPISKLTGYAVTGIDKLAPNGDGLPSRVLHPVDGQPVFNPAVNWFYVQHSAGLSLRKVDPACQDLLQWNDGSIAAGMRKLGKGLVIDLGSNSSALIPQILDWLHVKRVPCATGVHDIVTRHFISNNGLFDIWALWNSTGAPLSPTLSFRDGFKPASITEVNTGQLMQIETDGTGSLIPNLALGPWETRVFISPRNELAAAPAEWFALQRGWWRGTAPAGPPIPPFKTKLTVNLTEDWAFKPIEGAITGAPPENASLADPKLDDSSWPRRELGIFDIPDHPGLHHAIFRKRFTTPSKPSQPSLGNPGHVDLNVRIETGRGGGSRQYLDGYLIDPNIVNQTIHLAPGSSHLLTIDIWDPSIPAGNRIPVSISYMPDYQSRQPINDNWSFAPDNLTYGPPAPLPIVEHVAGAFRTNVKIDSDKAGKTVVLHTVTTDNHQHSIIVNGHATGFGGNCDVNITPWVKFGEQNEIVIVCDFTTMQFNSLDYYDPAQFP